jgi:hypothetical protein
LDNWLFLGHYGCLLEDPTPCKLLHMLLLKNLSDFFMHYWLVYFMDHINMLFVDHRLMDLMDNFLMNNRLDFFIDYWLDMLVKNVLMMFMNHRLMSLIYHILMMLLDYSWKCLCINDCFFLMTLNNGFFNLHLLWQPPFLMTNYFLLFDFSNDRWLTLCLRYCRDLVQMHLAKLIFGACITLSDV